MAAFHVDAVEPRLFGELCRADDRFPDPVEIPVVDDGDRDAVFLKSGAAVRDERRRGPVRLRIPSGVRRLHYHGRLGVPRSHRRFLDLFNKAREGTGVFLRQHQLTRICSPFPHYGDRFKPYDTRSARGETQITSDGQLAGGSVRLPVASLHRLI